MDNITLQANNGSGSPTIGALLYATYDDESIKSGTCNAGSKAFEWVLSLDNRTQCVLVSYNGEKDCRLEDVDEDLLTFLHKSANAVLSIREAREPEREYFIENGHLTHLSYQWDKEKREHVAVKTRLSNFIAWFHRAITYDDGAEHRKYFEINGTLDDPMRTVLPKLEVSAELFPRMEWVSSEWDGRAIIRVGSYIRDHTRAAIQFLSNEVGYESRYVYAHAGWRNINGKWCYLHAGGAITESGLDPIIDVEFKDTRLAVFDLPDPLIDKDLVEAVENVLGLLDDATERDLLKEWLVYFDLAKTFRAPLNEVLPITTSSFLSGRTGVKKTAYSAVWQGFFGSGFDAGTLPGNWSSTDNQIEKLLFIFKDALCEIDDFKPHGNATEVSKAHSKADRVFRGHANKQGRGRLRANSDFAPTYYSRAFPSSSGEDVPTGQSLRGRMLIRELKDGDIDLKWLSDAQAQAASGLYVNVMAAYLKWLAPQISELKTTGTLNALFNKKRTEYLETLKGTGAHAQTPGALADVYLGFVMLMRFALGVGAIDKDRAKELTEICEHNLITIGSYQGGFIRSEEPTAQFIDLVGALLSSRRAHLCDVSTNNVPLAPLEPDGLGWIYGRERSRQDEPIIQTWIAQGPCIGWIDEGTIYLEPSVTYAEAQKLARDKGAAIPFTEGTLFKRMNDLGLVTADPDGKHITRKKQIGSKRKRVLWIDADAILGSDGGDDE
jgi:hypothetical protein